VLPPQLSFVHSQGRSFGGGWSIIVRLSLVNYRPAAMVNYIPAVTTNPNSELMHQLRYNGMKIMPIQESMFQGEHQRIIIKDIVLDFLNKEMDAVILIKWQATDSLHQKYGGMILRTLTLIILTSKWIRMLKD
jgi:hypothetical protein